MKLIPDVSAFVAKSKERNSDPKTSMHSLELVITVVLFGVAGRFLDSAMDTTPVWTIVLGSLGVVGSFLSAYYRYIQTSKKLDENKVWAQEKSKVPAPSIVVEDEGLVVPKGYGSND